ncbi:hypothetical protein ACS0TY_021625 [Phlomoides rotata]
MVVGKSPEGLPPGFIEKFKYKNGRKIKYYLDVAKGVKYSSKKEVIRATEDNGAIVTPQKENGDENRLSIDNKVDVISIKENDSPSWLPNGWTVEEKTRYSGSSKGSVYKVYSDLSCGRKFYSKAAVDRYLNTSDHTNTMTVQNKIDNVDEPVDEPSANEPSVDEPSANEPSVDEPSANEPSVDEPNANEPSVDEPSTVMSPHLPFMSNTGDISNVDNKLNVDAASIDTPPRSVSMANMGGINKMKRKNNSYMMVGIERHTDDDLPPGWIKEIRIRKSGNKMRKDPYYTDPVSGYIFRSKRDAMRYLETNDIRKCACRPLKKELGANDIKLIDDEIPPSKPASEKLPAHKRRGGEFIGGEEPSGTKGAAESENNVSKQTQVHLESDSVGVEEKILCENSKKNPAPESDSKEDSKVVAAEIINNPAPESDSKEDSKVVAISSPVNSSKSMKRKGLSLPSRTSKRLAGSQPEVAPNVNLSENSLRAAAMSSDKPPNSTLEKTSSASVPLPSDIEQSKAVTEEAFKGDEAHQERLREIVENLFNDVEEPPKAGPDVQLGGEKQIDETKRTQEPTLCYDFGDSWSDPLEFAFKTLMGEISIDDPLTFPSCFSEQDNTPQNRADDRLKQPDAPQNEFTARAESSKQVPPSSSSLSPLGDIGFAASFGGFNHQASNEVGKKDFQAKFNP